MHTIPVARKVALSALVAIALLAGAMFVATPKASAGLEQCSANTVCVWEGNDFDGNFSWWARSNTGCHNHEGNPNIRSAWNRTDYRVRLGGWGEIADDIAIGLGSGSITGQICWPV
jgi:Peptidase inhibitor family I36